MDQRLIFDENIINYDKYRSAYVKELFDDLCSYSGCGKGSHALEVGCGTGQATAWVLQTGCALKAVEIGTALCEFTQRKFAGCGNLEIVNMPFEDVEIEDDSLDLVYSASAFHWIPEEVGYPKVRRALKSGGCFAVFGCPVEISSKNRELKDEIDALERRYFPRSAQPAEQSGGGALDVLERYGFRDRLHKSYSAYRTFTADEYVGLLLSVSAYHRLGGDARDTLLAAIRAKIAEHGTVEVHDKIDLYMGRK